MKLTSLENGILLEEIENFDPFVSCECGQCFRFERLGEDFDARSFGEYAGIAQQYLFYYERSISIKDQN